MKKRPGVERNEVEKLNPAEKQSVPLFERILEAFFASFVVAS